MFAGKICASHAGIEWHTALKVADVQINAYAESWLNSPDFPFAGQPETTEILMVILTVSELGLPHGGTRAELESAACTHGLEPCPVMAALALRLAWTDQSEGRLAREHRAPDGSVTVKSLPFLPEPPANPETISASISSKLKANSGCAATLPPPTTFGHPKTPLPGRKSVPPKPTRPSRR